MKEVGEMLSEIYFYELESRERIFNRLQLNFAIYASVIAVLAYMARMADYGSFCVVLTLFYVGLFASIILIAISIKLSINSFTGLNYRVFPRAQEILEYKGKIKNHAKEIEKYNQENSLNVEVPDPEKSANEYAIKILAKCIDHNSKINEYRRIGVRKSVWYMILAAIPIVISATLFVGFDLDASSPRKSFLVEDKQLSTEISKIDISINKFNQQKVAKEKDAMSDEQNNQSSKKTTPPPPPPPKEPEWQVSTEDIKASMPKKSKVLNEEK